MKSLVSWLLAMFIGLFWIFRVIVTFIAQTKGDFGGFIVFNQTVEIALLFITILCVVLYLRRNILGGIIYLISYGYYFGSFVITNIPFVFSGGNFSLSIMQNFLVAALGLLIAIIVFLELMLSRIRRRDPKDKKTDWFFQNENYDRKYDERADKNQYRNY